MTVTEAVPQYVPQVVDSTQLPEVAVKLVSGEYTESKRASGLILTQEDIINLKLYVKAGLALPIKDEEVVSYIGYSSSGIAGLEPLDIKALFLAIRGNVQKWDAIETDVKQQSIDLDIFASKITSTGKDIIQVIAEMPVLERVKQKVGTTNLENSGINIPFETDDHTIAYELKNLLEIIKKDIEKEKDKTAKVKTEISGFRKEIATELEPKMNEKRDIIKANKLDADIQDLSNKIETLNGEIEQLKQDYDKFVGLAFTGIAGGPIGLAITGGIFGDKAEKVRKLKNQKIDEKNQLTEQLGTKNSVKKAVESLGSKFLDVHLRLIDAEQAAEHLEFVWNIIYGNIVNSLDAFADINDSMSLLSFKTSFEQVINPWATVKSYASELIKLFDEAQRVYRELHQN